MPPKLTEVGLPSNLNECVSYPCCGVHDTHEQRSKQGLWKTDHLGYRSRIRGCWPRMTRGVS